MDFAATAIAVLIFLAIVIAGLAVERLAPAEAQPLAASGFNLCYTTFYIFAQALIAPALSILTVAAVNAAGGGWVKLPPPGLGSGWASRLTP